MNVFFNPHFFHSVLNENCLLDFGNNLNDLLKLFDILDWFLDWLWDGFLHGLLDGLLHGLLHGLLDGLFLDLCRWF